MISLLIISHKTTQEFFLNFSSISKPWQGLEKNIGSQEVKKVTKISILCKTGSVSYASLSSFVKPEVSTFFLKILCSIGISTVQNNGNYML